MTIISTQNGSELPPDLVDLTNIQANPKRENLRKRKIGKTSQSMLALPSKSDDKRATPSGFQVLSTITEGRTEFAVKNAKTYPWNLLVALQIRGSNGKLWHGTGWIAGPHTIVTAAHNVYEPDTLDTWASEIDAQGRCSTSFSILDPWKNRQDPAFNLAAIHLDEDEEGFDDYFLFEVGSEEKQERETAPHKPEALNLAGHLPPHSRIRFLNSHLRLDPEDEDDDVWFNLLGSPPTDLVGAPAFSFTDQGRPLVWGLHTANLSGKQEHSRLRRIDPKLISVLRLWTGSEQVQGRSYLSSDKELPNSDRIPLPTRLTGIRNSPRVVYITGGIVQQSPAEAKRDWDLKLFGNPMGCDTVHFHYQDLLPGLQVPIPPQLVFDGTLGKATKGRFGKEAQSFLELLTDDIDKTGDNPLLFGTANALLWLNIALCYFFEKAKKENESGRPAIRKLLLEELREISGSKRETVVVTHGFGAVILCDALLSPEARGLELGQVVSLASPIAYQAFRRLLFYHDKDNFWAPATRCPLPSLPPKVRHWLDLAIEKDPVAADEEAFAKAKNGPSGYDWINVRDVGEEELRESASSAYLQMDRLKNFLTALLPRGFGSPVGHFVFAKDVADQMSQRDTRVPVLLELQRVDCESGSPHDGAKAIKFIEKIVEVTAKAREEKPPSFKELKFNLTKRYVSADLLPRELKRLDRSLSAKPNEESPIRYVWQNTQVRSLTAQSTKVIQAEAARRTYDADGEGITWAVLDTGIDHRHEHFQQYHNIRESYRFTGSNVEKDGSKISLKEVEVDESPDYSGHGTHVAGILAGYWEQKGAIRSGIAPKTQIHSYRVLEDTGQGRESYLIRALEHIYERNARSQRLVIHGLNISLGNVSDPSVYGCGHSPICRELRRLWLQGVVICVAAGNAGIVQVSPTGMNQPRNLNLDISIGDPANLEECIAVGSVHRTAPHNFGVSYFSSRGPTADGRMKPDCVAPGERIESVDAGTVTGYRPDSGTSMACPHVSGVIAAFLSRKREFIGQPDRVKAILKECCIDIGRDQHHQGAGIPNLMAMLAKY